MISVIWSLIGISKRLSLTTPGLGGSPGERNGNPLQYSCLENPMDRGEPGGLQSMGSQRVGYDWATFIHSLTSLTICWLKNSCNKRDLSFHEFIPTWSVYLGGVSFSFTGGKVPLKWLYYYSPRNGTGRMGGVSSQGMMSSFRTLLKSLSSCSSKPFENC